MTTLPHHCNHFFIRFCAAQVRSKKQRLFDQRAKKRSALGEAKPAGHQKTARFQSAIDRFKKQGKKGLHASDDSSAAPAAPLPKRQKIRHCDRDAAVSAASSSAASTSSAGGVGEHAKAPNKYRQLQPSDVKLPKVRGAKQRRSS